MIGRAVRPRSIPPPERRPTDSTTAPRTRRNGNGQVSPQKTAPDNGSGRRNGQAAVSLRPRQRSRSPPGQRGAHDDDPPPWLVESRPSQVVVMYLGVPKRAGAQPLPRAQERLPALWRVDPRPAPRRRRSPLPPAEAGACRTTSPHGAADVFPGGLSCQPCWDQIGDREQTRPRCGTAGVDRGRLHQPPNAPI